MDLPFVWYQVLYYRECVNEMERISNHVASEVFILLILLAGLLCDFVVEEQHRKMNEL